MAVFDGGPSNVFTKVERELCDSCGAWTVQVPGGVKLTTGAGLVPVAWVTLGEGLPSATELRLDAMVEGGVAGDQVRFRIYAQQRREGGGGFEVVKGLLTLAVGGPGYWQALQATRGPLARSWGVLAELVTVAKGTPTTRKVNIMLAGMCSQGGAFVFNGENFDPNG